MRGDPYGNRTRVSAVEPESRLDSTAVARIEGETGSSGINGLQARGHENTPARRFLLKRWTVSVRWASGATTESTITASTRGKALADAWRCDAFSGSTFGEFLRFASCRRSKDEPSWWGEPITVLGKPAFYLGHDGQYVHFAYPDGDHVLYAHPLDVLPMHRRPEAYRRAA